MIIYTVRVLDAEVMLLSITSGATEAPCWLGVISTKGREALHPMARHRDGHGLTGAKV